MLKGLNRLLFLFDIKCVECGVLVYVRGEITIRGGYDMMTHDHVNILVISVLFFFYIIYNINILTMRISAGFKKLYDSDG